MNRVLVTGFGAFRDIEANPSQWLAEQVRDELGSRVEVLEVSYAVVDEFVSELDGDSFDAWLMMGVHGSAERMHLECVARNWCGMEADVRGEVRGPGMIDPALPGHLHGTLFAGRGRMLRLMRAVICVIICFFVGWLGSRRSGSGFCMCLGRR
ncbi:hypothetical protein CCB80_00310 [Armatimonadetes bacterium Uphvl-Ar1]|nr:hypothetical protein CCB80_00310 [Armatimonadetes bacterium Uphvl-Ar1]